MKRILVDVSSVLGQLMHIKDEEFGTDLVYKEQAFHIPHIDTLKESAEGYIQATLNSLRVAPNQLIMVRDPEGTGAARKRKYPFYKAGRTERPPAFYTAFNELVEWACELVMSSGGIVATPRVTLAVEADDLINELAIRLPNTMIWSVDKDLLACPAMDHYIGGEMNPSKFPVPRKFIHLYRSLIGDPSDNIPGCRGFGIKSWEALVNAVGVKDIPELEQVIIDKELHKLAKDAFPKVEMLQKNADEIYASYDLIGFLPVPMHKVKWDARVEECTKLLVTAETIDLTLIRIQKELRGTDHCVIDFETDVPDESYPWMDGTRGADGKGGVGVDVIASEITGMGLKVGASTYYFSVDHAETNNMTVKQLGLVIDAIGDKTCYAHNSTGFENVILYKTFGKFLEGMIDTKLMLSYVDENDYSNLKHASSRFLNYKQQTYGEVIEAAALKRPGVKGMRGVTGGEVLSYGLDDVITCDALQNLFTVIMEFEGSMDAFKQVEIDSAFTTSLAFYHGVDFDRKAYEKLKSDNDANILRAQAELETLLLEVGYGQSTFVPLQGRTIANVRRLYSAVVGGGIPTQARTVAGALKALAGVKEALSVMAGVEGVEEFLSVMALDDDDEMNALYKRHWKPTADLNVNSPKQVGELIYGTLGCPVRIRRPATEKMRERGQYEGNPSTDDEAILNAISFGDVDKTGKAVLEKLEEYKGYLTRESLFLSKYPGFVHWKTGKLHCSFTQSGTTTRRFTHKAPQLGQLPKKKGREVRDMVKAPNGWSIVSYDIDSQELRLQAEDCGCPEFISCFIGDKLRSVHALTGYQVAQMQGADVGTYEAFEEAIASKDETAKRFRADGKATNFASAYLCRSKRLSNMLAIDDKTAQLFLDAKAKAFPGLLPHVEEYNKLCKQRGYSLTFLGGVRHLAKAYAMAKNDGALAAVNRLAWSFRIQGSGAEMTKLILSRVYKSGLLDDLCRFWGTVHDEINFVIRNDQLSVKVPALKEIVCMQYADMKIPILSSPEVGKNFGSLSAYKEKK